MIESNYTKLPNVLIDEYAARLSGNALKVMLIILRKTVGWSKEADYISHSQFKALTGIQDDRTIKKCVAELVEVGLIEVYQRSGKAAVYMLKNFFNTPQEMQPPAQSVQRTPDKVCRHTKDIYTKQTFTKGRHDSKPLQVDSLSFRPWERSQNDGKRTKTGAHLGMASVKEIIARRDHET